MVELEKKIYAHAKELRDPDHPRTEIKLDAHEEDLLLDTIVYAESMNIWAMLMPAVYQLVPGSMIARMWFETIIPPRDSSQQENTFAGLMVTSISLALGLIIGEAMVEVFAGIFSLCFGSKKQETELKHEVEFLGAESPPDTKSGTVVVVEEEAEEAEEAMSDSSTWPL